jgi:two-component system chemotaxis response regulator CheB
MKQGPIQKPIRVVIIDDSSFIRFGLKKLLEKDSDIRVVGTARNGREGIDLIEAMKPDVATLDIEMPVMDGLTTLETVMREMPLPVIMISSYTKEGSVATLKALELGAVDFIPKRSDSIVEGIDKVRSTLIEKIKSCASCRPWTRKKKPVAQPVEWGGDDRGKIQIVTIGASTGGPRALLDVIPCLPRQFPAAVLVVQHMPAGFTTTFANRLDAKSRLPVKEAQEGDPIEPGTVLVAPGGLHLTVRRGGNGAAYANVSPIPSDSLFRPSVDIMMGSVADIYRDRVLAVIMTGMGCDGTEGMKLIKRYEGITLAQDQESCIVYGMPGCAVKAGIVDVSVDLDNLAREIVKITGEGAKNKRERTTVNEN